MTVVQCSVSAGIHSPLLPRGVIRKRTVACRVAGMDTKAVPGIIALLTSVRNEYGTLTSTVPITPKSDQNTTIHITYYQEAVIKNASCVLLIVLFTVPS